MAYLHASKLRAQVFMQLLGEINRPVLSASAADCNRNIASVDLTEVMEHLFDKSAQLFIERQTPFITLQKLFHRSIQARHASYISLPVGVGQCTRIENEIGISRDHTLEGKGLNQYG